MGVLRSRRLERRLTRYPAPRLPSGPSNVSRDCVVLTLPWALTRFPGARVTPSTAPDRAWGYAGGVIVDESRILDKASGFQPLDMPAAW